jgi:hypothetical protein
VRGLETCDSRGQVALGLVLVLCAAACADGDEPVSGTPPRSTEAGAAWFEEIAASAGLAFRHRTGATGRFYFPEMNGGGAAALDFDDDGFLDVFFAQSGKVDAAPGEVYPHGLFRNRGDGTFEDVTAGSGVATGGYAMGVTAGDYDNDGRTDLYLANVGPNVLLRNEGGGRFRDATREAGVAGDVWSSGACFSDLYVCNYVYWSIATDKQCFEESGRRTYCGPQSYNAPVPDQLFRNEGDGTFTDVSEAVGLGVAFGNALGVVSADFNGDGRLDFFVANDRNDDQLWINQEDGTLRDEALMAGCAVDRDGTARAGMGVDAGDIDNDGDLDLIVVNLHGEFDGFYRNEGRYFVEETTSAGIGLVTRAYTRFGVGFADFDNDGDLDLYQANGRVGLVGTPIVEDPYAEPNVLLEHAEVGKWRAVLPQGGTIRPLIHTSRGAAFGDFDNDGGVDVVVVNSNSAPYLLHNVRANRGHWLLLDVRGVRGAPAIGAQVYLQHEGHRMRRDVLPCTSYASSRDPRVHFGLGRRAQAGPLEVHWLDGTTEYFGPLEVDAVSTLRQGRGRAQP